MKHKLHTRLHKHYNKENNGDNGSKIDGYSGAGGGNPPQTKTNVNILFGVLILENSPR